MKIVHISDSHLGFQDLNKVDEHGRNVIEERVYSGLEQTINKIIDLKPDAVVHAGDVFHRDRPRIKPLYVFKQALENLIDAGIPFIAINGNHDAPKSTARTSPFFIYEGSSWINIAHQNRYEFFDVGDYRFHCIPYCPDPSAYESEFSQIKLSGRDVLIMHGMVKSLCGEKLNTVGEYELNDNFLQSHFDYIALGHYHGRRRISGNTWYSGSVEYFNFRETAQDKGILLVDLEKREVKPYNIHEIKYRLDCSSDCSGLDSEGIINTMGDICNREGIRDKIVRINLENLNRAAYKNINRIKLNEIKSPALHFSITTKYEEDGEIDGEQIDRLKLHEEFVKFIQDEISRDHANNAIRDEIVSYGVDLLKEVISSKNTEGLNASE